MIYCIPYQILQFNKGFPELVYNNAHRFHPVGGGIASRPKLSTTNIRSKEEVAANQVAKTNPFTNAKLTGAFSKVKNAT